MPIKNMPQMQQSNATQFSITSQSERQLNLIVPGLFQDKDRSAILQALLLKRDAIENVIINTEKNAVTLFFNPDKLAKENLFNLLENMLNHFSQKPLQKLNINRGTIKQSEPKYEIFFKVTEISCESCTLFLEMVLSKEADILQTNIDFHSKTGTVTGYLSEEKVFEIIAKNGYQATPIKTTMSKS